MGHFRVRNLYDVPNSRFSRYDDRRVLPAWRSGGGNLDYQRGQSLLATLGAIGAGCLAGLATGLLYTKGRIPTLLSGILVMTSCNSVILFVMRRANLGLLGYKKFQEFLPFASGFNEILIGLIFVTLVILGLIFFLDTRLGQAYIATGDNPDMAKSFGINTDRMELMGLVISNGIIALSGALMAQQEGYADASRGIGVIVIGLASLIIGEVLFSNVTLTERLLSIAIGSIAYQSDLGRDCAWHQYQLYSNLQCLDLGHLPDDSNL